MAKDKGLLNISANFNINSALPIDSRMRVQALSDLTNSSTFGAYYYLGMIVSVYGDVINNNGIYRLKALPITDITNWERIGTSAGGSATIDGVLGDNVLIGQPVYQKESDGKWYLAQATSGMLSNLSIATQGGLSGYTIKLTKYIRLTGLSGLPDTKEVYLSQTTAGVYTDTAPTSGILAYIGITEGTTVLNACIGLTGFTVVNNNESAGSENQDIIGMSISNSSIDVNNDINFTANSVCRLWDSTLTSKIKPVAGTFTKQLDALWSVGNNQGGLDSGVKSINTNYYLYMIWKSDLTYDYLFSLSATAPTLPSGYIYFRRLRGFVHTDASGNILGFIDEGNGKFTFKSRSTVVNNVAVLLTRTIASTILPPFFRGIFSGVIKAAEYFTTIRYICIGNTAETDISPSELHFDYQIRTASSQLFPIYSIGKSIQVGASSDIYYRGSNDNVILSLMLTGYEDNANL